MVTRAVAKLNIELPAERECQERPKSKLDERFLCSRSPPPCWGLTFFPDLHIEVSRLWNKPYSARLFSPDVSHYSNVLGLNECSYGKIPRVEDTLAGYLLPGDASSLKAPVLATKSLQTSSALVGKAYMAAGQAGGCLQAYQADLLKEMDEGDDIKNNDIAKLRRATDFSLRATKETARAIGRSMAAFVATERHLWLTLYQISDKDRVFLLDAPIPLLACSVMRLTQSSTGFRSLRNRRRLFSDFSLAVLKVRLIGRISPSRVPAPHIKKSKNGELPLVPLLKVKDRRGGGHSRSKSSKEMTDLRTVIFNKKASAKRS